MKIVNEKLGELAEKDGDSQPSQEKVCNYKAKKQVKEEELVKERDSQEKEI